MSENDFFNTPTDEAKILSQELRETKELLREISRKLGRIETRAKRAFPNAFPKQSSQSKTSSVGNLGAPTMTAEQVIQVYDEIVEMAKAGNRDMVRRRLDELSIPDLNLLRTELGASLGKKKPSKPVLIEAITGRVNESVMLTKHTSREELINRAGIQNEGSKDEGPDNQQR